MFRELVDKVDMKGLLQELELEIAKKKSESNEAQKNADNSKTGDLLENNIERTQKFNEDQEKRISSLSTSINQKQDLAKEKNIHNTKLLSKLRMRSSISNVNDKISIDHFNEKNIQSNSPTNSKFIY